MRGRRLSVASLLALAAAAAGCGGSQTSTTSGTTETTTTAAVRPADSLLFLFRSGAGTTTRRGSGGGSFRISFGQPRASVIAFTDRPDRRTNHALLQQFVDYWKSSSFATNPPNAAMVLTAPDGSEQVVVATLADPRLDGAGGALTFEATLLRDIGSEPATLSAYPPRSGGPLARFERATVFVDANAAIAPPAPQGIG